MIPGILVDDLLSSTPSPTSIPSNPASATVGYCGYRNSTRLLSNGTDAEKFVEIEFDRQENFNLWPDASSQGVPSSDPFSDGAGSLVQQKDFFIYPSG